MNFENMSLEELEKVAETLREEIRKKYAERRKEALLKLQEAWINFRSVVPNDLHWVSVEVECNDGTLADVEVDLYEIIDEYGFR